MFVMCKSLPLRAWRCVPAAEVTPSPKSWVLPLWLLPFVGSDDDGASLVPVSSRQLFSMCWCACELGAGETEFKKAKYCVSTQVY